MRLRAGEIRLDLGPPQAWEDAMAEGSGFEMKAHEQSYGRFIGLLKYGAVAAFVVTAIVVLIIAS
jgi:hypothetical protein